MAQYYLPSQWTITRTDDGGIVVDTVSFEIAPAMERMVAEYAEQAAAEREASAHAEMEIQL